MPLCKVAEGGRFERVLPGKSHVKKGPVRKRVASDDEFVHVFRKGKIPHDKWGTRNVLDAVAPGGSPYIEQFKLHGRPSNCTCDEAVLSFNVHA